MAVNEDGTSSPKPFRIGVEDGPSYLCFKKYSRPAGPPEACSRRLPGRGDRRRMPEGHRIGPLFQMHARRACKPDSVQGLPLWMAIPLGPVLPPRSSCQPGSSRLKRPMRDPYSALLPVGLAMPVLLPGPRWALTPPFHRDPDLRGRLFSVALSVGLRRPGVTRHRCFRESGLSSSFRPRPSSPPRALSLYPHGTASSNGKPRCQVDRQARIGFVNRAFDPWSEPKAKRL